MNVNDDWIELLNAFLKHDVKFLIVGGHAVSAHGFARYTEDLDIFIDASNENGKKILSAFECFFEGDMGFKMEHFTSENKVVMIGNAPNRVDVLTSIAGIKFEDAFNQRVIFEFGQISVPFIGYAHLIINKKAAGRPKDLGDVGELETRNMQGN